MEASHPFSFLDKKIGHTHPQGLHMPFETIYAHQNNDSPQGPSIQRFLAF